MESSDHPAEETVRQPAYVLDDVMPPDLRELADQLLERYYRVEYVDEGVLLIMNPPGPAHRAIVRLIVESILMAVATRATAVRWAIDSENFQWELPDQAGQFYVPHIVVRHPDARTPEDERAAIALIVEITSPGSTNTVYNDRVTKPRQYAKAEVPLYLLVDRERTTWMLHGLGSTPGYQLLAAGKFGENIPLPPPFGFSVPTAEWPA
jgi:Uma2 family endonuclease